MPVDGDDPAVALSTLVPIRPLLVLRVILASECERLSQGLWHMA